jgi:3-oxoacyl-[acyl-carrier-protein] synthase II
LAPFCKTSDGTVAGEGCAVFCIELEAHARERGAAIIAELAGMSSCFDPKKGPRGFNPAGDGARHAMKQACADAGLAAKDIGFIAASANGVPDGDAMEAQALIDLFPNTPVAAYKTKTGECIGASPCMSIACALADLRAGRISGVGSAYPLRHPVNLVFETAGAAPSEFALINSFSCDGYCGSIVLKNRA